MGQTFHNRGFSNSCFADKDGIIFGSTAKNLHHAFDLIFATDDGVHLSFAGELCEVATEGFKGRGFYVFASAGGACGGCGFCISSGGLFHSTCGFSPLLEIRIEFLENFLSGSFDIDFERFQNAGGHSITFAKKA